MSLRIFFSNLSDYILSEQYFGGSYDGAYFHQSVPKYSDKMFEVDKKDVQSELKASPCRHNFKTNNCQSSDF